MTTRSMQSRLSRLARSLPPPPTPEEILREQGRIAARRVLACPAALEIALRAQDYLDAHGLSFDTTDLVYLEMVAAGDAVLRAHEESVAARTEEER